MKVPSKFYYLPGAGPDGIPDLTEAAQLANPNIAGIRWRQDHATIQTAPAVFDWSAIDAELELLVANDKLLGLSVAWGDSVADWIYDTVEEFEFDPMNEVGSMPNPFDPLYLPIVLNFIAAMGAIYDPHPNVSYVVVSGFMQHFEGYLAKTADEETRLDAAAVTAGFTGILDGWTQIGQAIMGAFVTAFPNTAVLYTSAKPFPSDAGAVQQNIFRDWIVETFSGHAGWMTAQLKASPAPWDSDEDVEWPHGFQAISDSTDLSRFYGASLPSPDPVPPQPMIDFCHNGRSKGAQFLEIYPFDFNLSANQTSLSELALLFHSFVEYIPPGDTPPPPDPEPPPPIDGDPPVIARVTVPRIVQCQAGTHARNIILARKRLGPPVIVPSAPGPVEILDVETPHTPSSGQATATWLSPVGSDAANLSYIAYLTGGSGTITIVSQEPV